MDRIKSFKNILRTGLRKAGIGQKEIATYLGVSTPVINRTLKDATRTPELEMLFYIAKRLNKNIGLVETELPGLNTDLLKIIIEGIEDGLKKNERTASPERKAGIIAFLYDRYSKTGEKVTKEKIIEHLRLVA